MTTEPTPPGSTIGILGGGQLGRMIALAAARLGFRVHVFCPDPASPAFDVAAARTIADYDDEAALRSFAAAVDLVTYEFENVPSPTAEILAAARPLWPDARALATAQDRLAEKRFLDAIGIPVAAFAPIDGPGDIDAAVAVAGLPAIVKTRRLGYDGKGQARADGRDSLLAAIAALGGRDLILEALVPFDMEISAIVVRGIGGETLAYDVGENLHESHILRTTTVPAALPEDVRDRAAALGRLVAERLDYVGVLGVEMFVTSDGSGSRRILVNEIAPRVHNSGHWTEDGAVTSQFENHVRAIAGWPLGSTRRLGSATMTNLIGSEADDWLAIAGDPTARLHLYGKAESRPGRKMGHVNRVRPPEGE